VLKNKDLIYSKVFLWSSKLLSFMSLHRYHKRHEGTIFHIIAVRVLLAVHQQAYKSTNRLGITQDNPNRLKKTFQLAQATSQRKRRWSTDFPFFLQIQHLSTIMTTYNLVEGINTKQPSFERDPPQLVFPFPSHSY
jgi:hypothetical protein